MNKQKQLEEMARRKPLKAASHDLEATVTEVQRMRRERNLPEWSRREIINNFNSTHEKLRRGR